MRMHRWFPSPGSGHERPRRQAIDDRNEHWRHDHEVGRYDPVRRVHRRYSVVELARLNGLTARAIRFGIDQARAVRAEIHDRLEKACA